jgi:putative transposase
MHKTFSFKLYRSEKNRCLHRQIEIAASIWNHCIALHRRYYRLYHKTLNKHRLQRHLTKLKHRPRFRYWNELGSQAVQDITDRIDRAYTLFFRNRKTGIKPAPPGFRPRHKYRSFTLKQSGWALQGENRVRIGRQIFRFSKSREIEGTVKTVTLKRDPMGDLYVFFCCEVEDRPNTHVTTGKIAGADFGLKDFLTFSDGSREVSPLFYREGRKAVRSAAKKLSSKQKGSNNRRKARTALARIHKRIADKRRDHHFKLARELTLRYDYLFLEDLNLKGMQRLWGRKIGDLGFALFVSILHHQASKAGSVVHHVGRWFPSSKLCSACGTVNEALNLKDRHWRCVCGAVHDRDHNAALNILLRGGVLSRVRRRKASRGGCRLTPESPSFGEGSTSMGIL